MAEKPVQKISPERLNDMIQVTDSKGWLALLSFALILALAIFWLFFGKIPITVQGTCVLINTLGIRTIITNVAGSIEEFNVKPGDIVQEHQVIGKINQFELMNQ